MARQIGNKLTMSSSTKGKLWILGFCQLAVLCFLLFQGGKLAFMLFVIMAAISLYLLLGKFSGIGKVQGERKLLSSEKGRMIQAGNTVTVKVNVQIPGILPIPYIIFRDQLTSRKTGKLQMMTTFIPDWKRRGEIIYNTPPLRRGRYRFGNMAFSTEDIFGIFEHSGIVLSNQTVSVYPQTIAIPEWKQFQLLCKGLHDHTATTRAWRETTQINGVREYVYGDGISRIHWNATARTGTWKSKEFEREALPKMIIVLDRDREAYRTSEQFELAVSTAASLIQFGKNQNLSQGLLSIGKDNAWFSAKRDEAHYREMMDYFIEVEADGDYSLDKVIQGQSEVLTSGSLLIYISPAHDDRLLQSLHWADRNGMSACHMQIASSHEPRHHRDWPLLLKARGYQGYVISSLKAIPQLLGGA